MCRWFSFQVWIHGFSVFFFFILLNGFLCMLLFAIIFRLLFFFSLHIFHFRFFFLFYCCQRIDVRTIFFYRTDDRLLHTVPKRIVNKMNNAFQKKISLSNKKKEAKSNDIISRVLKVFFTHTSKWMKAILFVSHIRSLRSRQQSCYMLIIHFGRRNNLVLVTTMNSQKNTVVKFKTVQKSDEQ